MRTLLIGVAVFLWANSANAILPVAYEMDVIPPLNGLPTFPAAINDHGVVVGTIRDSSFRYADGVMEEIPMPGNFDLWKVIDINNNGQMIIAYSLATENDPIKTALGSPETGYTLIPNFRGTSLNDNGTVVGVASDIGATRSDDQFAIFRDDTLTILGEGTPGAINNFDQFMIADYFSSNYCQINFYSDGSVSPTGIEGGHCVVDNMADDGTALVYASASFTPSLPFRLFTYKDGVATELDNLAYPWAFRNASGTIATYTDVGAGIPIAWEDGDFVDVLAATTNPDPVFNDSGILTGMNARGQIVIMMDDLDPDDESYRGVILTPVNTAPILEPIANQLVNENDLLTIQLAAVDPEGDQVSYTGLNLSSPDADQSLASIGASLDPSTGLFSWAPSFDQAGNYEIEFAAHDDGEPSKLDLIVVTITVGNVNRIPVFGDIFPISASVGDDLQLIIEVSDPDGDYVEVTSDSLPTGASFGDDTHYLYWIPAADQIGVHVIELTGTDRNDPPGIAVATLTITVGNIFTPAELIDFIATTILDLDLPKNVEKKLIKPLQKLDKHYMKGKVDKAIAEARNFIDQVNLDLNDGDLDAATAAELINLAEQLITLLQGGA